MTTGGALCASIDTVSRRPLTLMYTAAFLALAVALTALAGGGGAYHTGHAGPSADAPTNLSALWAVPPVEVAALLLLGVLYGIRVHRVGGVDGKRQLSFYSGIALILIAICSPLGGIAQQGLLTAHMLQHTLIGAAAPLLLLLGVPRAFAADLLSPSTRRVLQRLQHPLVAFPLWAVGTVVWLLPDLHHAVLENGALWIIQQTSILVLGPAAVGPRRRGAAGPGVVRHRDQGALHDRGVVHRTRDRQRLLVLGDGLLPVARLRGRRPGGSRRSRIRPTRAP